MGNLIVATCGFGIFMFVIVPDIGQWLINLTDWGFLWLQDHVILYRSLAAVLIFAVIWKALNAWENSWRFRFLVSRLLSFFV